VCPSVRPSVRLSVCLFVTSVAYAKTARATAVINGLFESSFYVVSGKVCFVNMGHSYPPLILSLQTFPHGQQQYIGGAGK
jgi:hypothetical protein